MNINLLNSIFNRPWVITPEAHSLIKGIATNLVGGQEAAELSPQATPELVTIIGKVAIVDVAGVILNKPSEIEEYLFGAFSLRKFKSAIASLRNNEAIETIILNIDSPGGEVTGVMEAGELLAEVAEEKNLVAFSDGMICSAAYWLASQADQILASPSSTVGSIGVYTFHIDQSQALQNEGIKLEVFKAGRNKAMGLGGTALTDEQRAILQADVDKIYTQFTEAVLSKRDLDSETMQGLAYDGEQSMELGLIDDLESDLDSLIEFYNGVEQDTQP